MEPITLTNLHTKSLQEVFDYVATHMLTQDEHLFLPDGYNCAYRGVNGRMCAVGCLIADDEYEAIDLLFRRDSEQDHAAEQESIEGTRRESICRVMNRAGIARPSEEMQAMLAGLQRVHDDYSVHEWPDALSSAAAAHGLTFNPEKYCNA